MRELKSIIFCIGIVICQISFAQSESSVSEIKDSIDYTNPIVIDSIARLSQTKNSDSLNGYLFDDLYGIIDTSIQSKYPFIRFFKNNFRFYTKDSPAFERLFANLKQTVKYKKGKLNFYHIGGSHLQADIYSNVIREHLQTYWEDLPGERGWVFPFKMAKTNNPWNYAFHSDNKWTGYRSVLKRNDSIHFGLLGMAITTTDSLVNLRFEYRNTEVRPPIDHIKIYHNKGVLPYLIHFDSIKHPVSLQYTNESLGFTEVYFTKEIKDFEVFFTRIDDSIFYEKVDFDSTQTKTLKIYGFQLMNNRPGISYTSIGVNGAGLYTYRDNENFTEQLGQSPPDLMIFSVGTNDANVPYEMFKPEEFRNNLEIMMKKTLAANPNCAILLTVPNDSYYKRRYYNRNIAREREVIYDLAKKYQIPVWDLYGVMGELGSSKTWRTHRLIKADLIHFTADGYRLKGEMFFEAFLKWIEQMELRHENSILKEK
ncbi:MAG: GDSL-type esterase/lipase family protein [Brumimicrobium sp.]